MVPLHLPNSIGVLLSLLCVPEIRGSDGAVVLCVSVFKRPLEPTWYHFYECELLFLFLIILRKIFVNNEPD